MTDEGQLPAGTRMGPVTLSVRDHGEVSSFYTDTVGLEVIDETSTTLELGVASTGLLRLRERPELDPRPTDAAGLFHVAIRVPDHEGLADAAVRLRQDGVMTGASDHGVSEALYASDPAGNGIEIYHDRPRERWPMRDDHVELTTDPLDVDALIDESTGGRVLPESSDIGHVHLEVTDLARSARFYVDTLGFAERDRHPGARFVAAGGYHHHIGLNTWNGRRAAATGLGELTVSILVPTVDALDAAVDRLEAADHPLDRTEAAATVTDPDGVDLRVSVD